MLDWLREQVERQGAARLAVIGLAIVSALGGIFLCTVTMTYASSTLTSFFSPSASGTPPQVPTVVATTSSSDANPVFPYPTPVIYPPNPVVPVITVGTSSTPAPAPTPTATATLAPSPIPSPTATLTPSPSPVSYQVALSVPPSVRRGQDATATVNASPAPPGGAQANFSASFNIGGQQNGTVPLDNNGNASWQFHVPLLATNGSVTVTVVMDGQNLGSQTVPLNIVGR